MFIGEVAKRTGASLKAIRLYEALGLLGRVRRKGSYRVYSDENVRQVQMIRQAQTLGFRLSELEPVLRSGRGEPDWDQLLQQLNLKRASVRQEMKRLMQLEVELTQIVTEIQMCMTVGPHPDGAQCQHVVGRSTT